MQFLLDHTPQDQDAKRLPFNQAEFGGVGLETLLPLTLNLVKKQKIDLVKAIYLLTQGPAKVLGISVGKIKVNEADLSLLDLTKPWKVNPDFVSWKIKNSPFDEMLVEGKNLMTFC